MLARSITFGPVEAALQRTEAPLDAGVQEATATASAQILQR
jgi:hypothetical protein